MPLCANAGCPEQSRAQCGRCKQKRYCSRECQAKDFKTRHKRECKKLVAYMSTAAPESTASATTITTTTDNNHYYFQKLSNDVCNHIYSFLDCMALAKMEEAIGHTDAKRSTLLVRDHTWKSCFMQRFPCCSKGLQLPVSDQQQLEQHSNNKTSWKQKFKLFLNGEISTEVAVFNREINRHFEFALSCYDTRATFVKDRNMIHATYPDDGRGLITDLLTLDLLRDVMQVGDLGSSVHVATEPVLADQFAVGDGVEIQWKRQMEHPFGWWYGHVQKIWLDDKVQTGPVGDIMHMIASKEGEQGEQVLEGQCILVPDDAKKNDKQNQPSNGKETNKGNDEEGEEKLQEVSKITVEFKQYNPNSPWFTVTVVLGTTEPVRGMGGYLGGLRKPSAADCSRWEQFLLNYQQLDPLGQSPVIQQARRV